MKAPTSRAALLAGVLLAASACRSACLDPDQPRCVERYDGTWLVAHRLRTGLGDRDVLDEDPREGPTVALRGDAALGTGWALDRTGETWALGFPEAGAVSVLPVPRGVGTCSASATRVLTYVPDDTLDRQPRLEVQASGCSDVSATEDVLFTGPSDFGRQVLAWPTVDGTWDLWVAAPAEGLGRGALFRFSDAPARDDDGRTFGDARLLEGDAAGDHLGQVLRRCGDLDGDGLDELVVGIPGYTSEQGALAGAVAVISPDALPDRDWTLEDADAVLAGDAGDAAGTDVACRADLTGDGLADLVIGAPGADAEVGNDAGAVWVVPGGGLETGSVLAQARWTWPGGVAGERLGTSVAIGDLDGNGAADLVAGAPGSSAGGPGSGAVRTLLADELASVSEPGAIYVGRVGRAVDGVQSSLRLGQRTFVADLDEDGQVELISATWRADRDGARLHAGEVAGWSGEVVREAAGASYAERAFVIAGTASHQEVGRLLQVEDIDNDGAIDIVTQARRRAR